MAEEKKKELTGPFRILALPLSFVLGVWRAYALTILWGWFVVPSFPWMPALAHWQVYGLMILFYAARYMDPDKLPDRNNKEWIHYMVSNALIPAVYLGFGKLALLWLR